jgi:hypothetical protein
MSSGVSLKAIYHTIGVMTIIEEITLPGFMSDVHAFGYQLANTIVYHPIIKDSNAIIP